MKVTDYIALFALIGAAIGLWLNYKQLVANNRQKAAEFIISLSEAFTTNEYISKMYNQIEYGSFVYTDTFHGSDFETPLDNLLAYFENFAKLYQLSNFNLDDLKYFAYRYLVVYQDSEVNRYLEFLDSWYVQRGMKMKAFQAFREVGAIIEKKYFEVS